MFVGGQVFASEVRIGQPPGRLAGLERIKMRIGPAHGGLQGRMQPIQPDIGGHLENTAHPRLDIVKRYLDLDNGHAASVASSGLA